MLGHRVGVVVWGEAAELKSEWHFSLEELESETHALDSFGMTQAYQKYTSEFLDSQWYQTTLVAVEKVHCLLLQQYLKNLNAIVFSKQL